MSERKRKAALRQAASVLDSWPEPHGAEKINVIGADMVDGLLRIAIQPARPQCPCCLVDLEALRNELMKKKSINNVHLEVMGIPAANRWTRAINS